MPSSSTAHAVRPWTALDSPLTSTDRAGPMPLTRTGVGESSSVPSPSSPWSFAPQQNTRPSSTTAQLWSWPTATSTTAGCDGTVVVGTPGSLGVQPTASATDAATNAINMNVGRRPIVPSPSVPPPRPPSGW